MNTRHLCKAPGTIISTSTDSSPNQKEYDFLMSNDSPHIYEW